ncbi:MAG: glycosyltransferase [Lentimicrobiaceae bacterium]|jgi:glycosyltransferase involved in cell wall biosynthesis
MEITTGQFNDSYFPIMDGVGITAHNYARWLNEKYGKSIIITPKASAYEDHVPYQVYRFRSVLLPGMNPYRLGLPMIDIKFKKKIQDVGFDLVHAHCPFISGQLALKLSKKLDVPLVTTFHTKYREDFKKAIHQDLIIDFLMNFTLDFFNSADLVWVPNKATGLTLQEYGFKGPYEVMPNGCDMIVPDKLKLLDYRKKGLNMINACTDEFVMLFVGQHRWEKNVRLIIDSLKQLKDKGKLFKMVFVGEGYAASDMQKLVGKYNLQDNVVFLGVITDRNELQFVYAASDLFIFPSVYDNSPLVMQEAAAFGVPSIVIRNSSSAEGILDGANGFLVENESADLSQKILALMQDQHAIKKAGEGACKSIYHPWESIVDEAYCRYVELIRSFKHGKTRNQS